MTGVKEPQGAARQRPHAQPRRTLFRVVAQAAAAGGVAGALPGLRALDVEAATVSRRRYGVFNANGSADEVAWRKSGGTHVSVIAYWDQLQSAAGGALSAGAVADLRAQIAAAVSAGL